MRYLMIPVCAWLSTAAACMPDGAVELVAQPLENCTQLECTGNSPVIDGMGFHDLYTNGDENVQGFAVKDLVKSGLNYRLEVVNGNIRGLRTGSTLQGLQLEGAAIRLRWKGTKDYLLRIKKFHQVPTASAPQVWWSAYEFEVDLPNKETVALCSKIPEKDVEIPRELSVVFERDLLDAGKKTVTLDPNVFTIGCAGSAPAKMVVNMHTYAAAAFGYPTKPEQRQAFLKMITGDYCGNGTPYTVAGQPLEWQDALGYVDYKSPLAKLAVETRWTSSGAQCLNKPRINANHTDLGDATFDFDVVDDIEAECPGLLTKECGSDLNAFDSADFISANPIL